MIDLRSIRILGLIVCFACTIHTDAWAAPNTNHKCQFPPPETWNTHEQWAWDEHLCLGTSEVDFSEHDELNCNVPIYFRHPQRAKRASISSEFIKYLLTHHQAKEILTENSTTRIELRCGVLDRELDLRNIRTDKELRFDEFHFNHGFSIDENNRLGGLVITNSTIRGDLSATGVSFNDDIWLEDSEIHSKLVLSRAEVGGNIIINRTEISGGLYLDYSTIKGFVSIVGPGPSSGSRTKCSLGESKPTDNESDGTEPVGLELSEARLEQHIQIGYCTIHGNISTIGGPVHVKGSKFEVLSTNVYGDMNLSHANIDGRLVVAAQEIGAVKLAYANVGKGLYIGVFPIEELNLSDSKVFGELRIAKCRPGGPKPKLDLRNAYLGALKLEPEAESKCKRENVILDVVGLTYDMRMVQEIMNDRNKEERETALCRYKKWLLPDEETHPSPQPYTQMADALAELGYIEKAKEIRIEERKENLQHLAGWDLAWQWIIGRTTHFGYEPQQALKWLVGLILAGTMLLICASVLPEVIVTRAILWVIPSRWRGWRCVAAQYTSRYIWILPVIVIGGIAIGWVAFANKRAEDISGLGFDVLHSCMFDTKDAFSVGDTVAVLSIGALLLIVVPLLLIGRGVDFKNAATNSAVAEMQPSFDWKEAGKLCFSAFLYSIDRAVPFLSFDSEHVKWFKEGHHLNDRGLLCLYFYAHAVVGFTLISLFLAGLTGILR